MISYIKGKLISVFNDSIIVENNNIGYNILVPSSIISTIGRTGIDITIYTYMYVREDAIHLYGFLEREDIYIFKLLIGISGIGPKGALGILSTISYNDLKLAVLAGDSKAIAKSPGIGNKTAQKIIIELKDKLKIEDEQDYSDISCLNNTDITGNAADKEAILALVSLGYSQSEAAKAVSNVEDRNNMDSEQILKTALKNMF